MSRLRPAAFLIRNHHPLDIGRPLRVSPVPSVVLSWTTEVTYAESATSACAAQKPSSGSFAVKRIPASFSIPGSRSISHQARPLQSLFLHRLRLLPQPRRYF